MTFSQGRLIHPGPLIHYLAAAFLESIVLVAFSGEPLDFYGSPYGGWFGDAVVGIGSLLMALLTIPIVPLLTLAVLLAGHLQYGWPMILFFMSFGLALLISRRSAAPEATKGESGDTIQEK